MQKTRAGQAAEGQVEAALPSQSAGAVPGPQSRAPGVDHGKLARMVMGLEAGQDPFGPDAAAKQAGYQTLLYRPDGQDHRQTLEIKDLSTLDRNAGRPLKSEGMGLGNFAALNQRRAEAGNTDDLQFGEGFEFAALKDRSSAPGRKAAALGQQAPFNQNAFLNTPLDRLDEAEVRRAMTQPAYYQSWRPGSRDMNDHVTNWFRQAYPG